MAHKIITKLSGLMMLLLGLLYLSVAVVAALSIDVSAITGRDLGLLKVIIDATEKDVLLNIMVLFIGYYFSSWGVTILGGKPKKVLLDYRINYKVVAIETDEAKGTVKIDLKDTRTGDEITVQKETKHLKYFKDYVNLNGDIMPGGIAGVV
ncbi:MAG: hypothetical protein WC788_05375 [Candidatus Paceibacterota bacterium]|jgi:hypothetical protein